MFNAPRTSLRRRKTRNPTRATVIVKSRKLTNLEEEGLIQRIIQLDSQGFPVRISGIEEIANLLRRERDASPVGKNWAENFIRR